MSTRYQVLGTIGSGGMAQVFRVKVAGAGGFEKVLAMKRISADGASEPDAVKMLMDEARIAARLSHPNIVQVFDFDEDEQGYFLTMELVEGPDLSTVLRDYKLAGRILAEACSTWVGIQILHALDYAHRRVDSRGAKLGLVHRDISPGNILLTPEGVAKLSDFGIAYALDRLQQTGVGMLKGKLAYMSPEQARTQRLDGRSDVYSLGLVLWECLAGVRCHDYADELRVLKNAQDGKVRSFLEVGIQVPSALQDIVAKALAREPDNRWQTAGEMAEALERYHRRAHPDFTPEHLGAALSGTSPAAAVSADWIRSEATRSSSERTRIEEAPSRPGRDTTAASGAASREVTQVVFHPGPPTKRGAPPKSDRDITRETRPPEGRRATGELPAVRATPQSAADLVEEFATEPPSAPMPAKPPPPPVASKQPPPPPPVTKTSAKAAAPARPPSVPPKTPAKPPPPPPKGRK